MEPRHPRYGVVTTLLDCTGGPDTNRKTIVDRWKGFANVAIFNNEMVPWTLERARQLELCLEALNADAKRDDEERAARFDDRTGGGASDRTGE